MLQRVVGWKAMLQRCLMLMACCKEL